jgi:hypothetical protein
MTQILAPAALEPAQTAFQSRDLVLSCSLCWSGQGDCTDPASGAVVCFSCAAELAAGRTSTHAQDDSAGVRDGKPRP